MQRASFWCTKKQQLDMTFEWRSVRQGDYKEDFKILKKIFIQSFSAAYQNFSAADLKLAPALSKEKFLENAITEDLNEMITNPHRLSSRR